MHVVCVAALLVSVFASQLQAHTPKPTSDGINGEPHSGHLTSPNGRRTMPAGGRPQRPQNGGRDESRRRPNGDGQVKMEFTCIFRVENATFQNLTNVPLKEGDTVFFEILKPGGRGHHNHKGGKHGLPEMQYVKFIYNSSMPKTISIEYGTMKPKKLSPREEKDQGPRGD